MGIRLDQLHDLLRESSVLFQLHFLRLQGYATWANGHVKDAETGQMLSLFHFLTV